MKRADIDIDAMTHKELKCELQSTLDELDDLNVMQQAVLGQTGIHIGVVLLQKYRNRFDRDRERLEEHTVRMRSRLAIISPERENRQNK